MNDQFPLVNSDYLLEKYHGKGGWTYASIPEIQQNKNNPFGWVKVKGSIDDYEQKNYKLMPMGEGKLFLPVKAEIRKKIKKEAGDYVRVILYNDDSPLEIPAELIRCFDNEPPHLFNTFNAFTEGEQKAYIDWIYAAKTDNTRVNRIVKMMRNLEYNQKLNDK